MLEADKSAIITEELVSERTPHRDVSAAMEKTFTKVER
jgi:hypothetical protein